MAALHKYISKISRGVLTCYMKSIGIVAVLHPSKTKASTSWSEYALATCHGPIGISCRGMAEKLKFGTAISLQLLNGKRTKLYREASSIICGKESQWNNFEFPCDMPTLVSDLVPEFLLAFCILMQPLRSSPLNSSGVLLGQSRLQTQKGSGEYRHFSWFRVVYLVSYGAKTNLHSDWSGQKCEQFNQSHSKC